MPIHRQHSAAGAAPPDAGARPPPIQTFRYGKPADQTRPKAIVSLCRSDIVRGAVQVVRKGGGNNLHSHTGTDGLWMVLRGRARFYGPGNTLMGEFDPFDGILIPRNTRYRFESVGEEDLELLQVDAFDHAVRNERVDAEPRRPAADSIERFDGRVL